MESILRFIKTFQSPSNEILFKECACYWFAMILYKRFADSCIVYDPEQIHFATKIGDHVYDISGIVEDDSSYVDWREYENNSVDSELIISECIYFEGGDC